MYISKEALQKCFDGTPSERKFLCEHHFGLFALYYFGNYFKYSLADFHYEMMQDLHDLESGLIRECAWIMFRESGKTTMAKLFIVWLICTGKRHYINVDSLDKENSERILFDVAYELVNNKLLQDDYGVLFSREKTITDIKQNRINNFVTENGIRVEAHSTQESVRGRIHLNQRPDALVLDDIENNKTKDSEAYTKQVAEHISEAMAGMSPNGFILYLGNYLTEYGNIQHLLDRSKSDFRLRIRNVPVMVAGKPMWESKYAVTDEEAKKTGKVSIEDKQRQLGSYVFSYEMMNQPVDDTLSEFKKNFIQYATVEEVKRMNTNCYITIDSAVSEKDSADYTGITINRVTEDNKWFVLTYRLKCNSKELIDHIFELHDKYNPMFIGLEETTFTIAIQPFIDEEKRKRNKFFNITPIKHKGINKETRIRGLIPRWESHAIFLVGDNMELLEEMRVFPRGSHDDVIDSLSMTIPFAQPPYKPVYHPPGADREEVNRAL